MRCCPAGRSRVACLALERFLVQVVIDKSLKIEGQVVGGVLPVVSIGFSTGTSGDSRGWFLVQAGAVLDVKDLVFDGKAPTGPTQQVYQVL